MRRGVYAVFAAGFVAVVTASFIATRTTAQTTCPVSGEAINTSFSVDYQGQRIYFCCGKCPGDFRHDPEKYLAKLDSAGVRLENVQLTCPVSGESVQADPRGEPIEVKYKGRTVRLCCKSCKPKFEADPDRYLAMLPGEKLGSRQALN